jgi:hypothetical protein
MVIPLVNFAMLFTACLLVLLVTGIPWSAANFIANLYRWSASGKLKPFKPPAHRMLKSLALSNFLKAFSRLRKVGEID